MEVRKHRSWLRYHSVKFEVLKFVFSGSDLFFGVISYNSAFIAEKCEKEYNMLENFRYKVVVH